MEYRNALCGKILLLFGALIISTNVLAQTKSTQNTNQQWIQFYEKAKLSSHWALFADAGYRRKDFFAETSQYIARVALGYQLNPHMRFSAGFANLGFYSSGPLSKLEFRPYEEWMISNAQKAVKIQQRFRFEERFFKAVNDKTIQPGTDFDFRFRYRLMFNISIHQSPSGPMLSVNAGNELLVNAGKTVANDVSYQYRILIGPALKLNKNYTLTLTYNSQFASGKDSGNYEHLNIIWLGIKHRFSISHPKNVSK